MVYTEVLKEGIKIEEIRGWQWRPTNPKIVKLLEEAAAATAGMQIQRQPQPQLVKIGKKKNKKRRGGSPMQ